MPLSDNLRYFLTHIGMSPQQQAQERAQQAQLAQQAGQFQQQLAQQADLERAKLAAGIVERGGMLGQPPRSEPPAQGGPSFYGQGELTQEAPGTPTPRAPETSIDQNLGSIMPWLQMFGLQQQAGQSMNAPGAIPSGVTSVGNRLMPTNAASGGGGVVSPAAPSARPVVPTVFNIPFPGQAGPLQGYFPQQQPLTVNIPKEHRELFGGQSSITMDDPVMARQLQNTFVQGRQRLAEIKAQATERPVKAPSKEVELQQTAAQLTAKAAGLSGTFARISDLPLEQQEAAWNRHADLAGGEIARKAKEERLFQEEERSQRMKEARASDDAAMDLLKQDGQAWFDVKDKDQHNRLLMRAKSEGLKLPTRQIKGGQFFENDQAADTVQATVNRMREIAKALGPASFGAVVGRMKAKEGNWGNPVFTDPLRASLEEEFRNHSKLLTAQETKLVGGGRASVMLYNAVKDITPQQWMQMGTNGIDSILEGAFRGTYARAQYTKNAIKRWAYGEIENPLHAQQASGHKKGDIVTVKGQKVKLTSDPDAGGNFSYEVVR